MAQTDAPPAEAPAPAPEAQPAQQAPPPVQEAPPGQRSTGGDRPMEADAKATPLNRESAQELMRKAYSRSRSQRAEEKAPERQERQPVKQVKAEVDKPATAAVQEEPTPAPEPDAPQDATARGRDPSTGRFSKAQAPAPRPPAEAPSPAPQAEAPATEEAPASADAPASGAASASPSEDFKTERWQAAFADDPGLRRRVARISADPSLSAGRKAEMLSEKLLESVEGVQQERGRAQQIADFRRRDPQGYIRWEQAQEAEAEQHRQLELRITQMIADAYGVDAADPDFQSAGPQEGDDHETGLQRFVDFTAARSPVLQRKVAEAVQAKEKEVAERYQARIRQLEERHKTALEAAVEKARGQARSPVGTYRPPPRSNGTGQRPVGEDDGLAVAQKAPDSATVRGLIGLGYQRRE